MTRLCSTRSIRQSRVSQQFEEPENDVRGMDVPDFYYVPVRLPRDKRLQKVSWWKMTLAPLLVLPFFAYHNIRQNEPVAKYGTN